MNQVRLHGQRKHVYSVEGPQEGKFTNPPVFAALSMYHSAITMPIIMYDLNRSYSFRD
jgi:hypothetical protein